MNLIAFFKEKIKLLPLYLFVTTASNVVFILFSFSLLNEESLAVFINSDTLYLPSIYEDVTEFNNTLKKWNLNPAPNFFPDNSDKTRL